MQLVGPEQGVAFMDLLTLCRACYRSGHTMTVVGPLTRLQQEQVSQTRARWVNLPLAPYQADGSRTDSARQLRRLLQSDPVDLLHCYGLAAAATAAAALPRFGPRPRLVLTLDDLSAHHLSTRQNWAVRRLLRQFGALIAAADSELQALARIDRSLAMRAHLVHFAADVRPITADFDLARKRRSLGLRAETAVIGVLSPATRGLGLETFISAADRITRDFPNVEFLIVGDGPDQAELIMQAHQQGSGGAIVFRGQRADLAEVVATLNILVIPREVPGSIVYVLQALTQEIPVVSVRTPALETVIAAVDPEAFVPQDDVEALTAALAQRLEILPPADSDDFSESLFSYRDMVVSGAGFDLDQVGLEAGWRGDESQMQRAVREAQAKHSPGRTVAAVEALYQELLG
jgi:glycosyltransferase involved in cell wall biosynthesis